jgi:hypothetical protein
MTHTPAHLHTALRTHAKGLYADEAATELLIAHDSWLHRPDFLARFVDISPGLANGTPVAAVDWPGAITALDAGHLPCSSGEARILKITASLADGIPVDLRDALTGLDATNLDLIAQAVFHTGGR